jgi:hypothetical protein
VLQSSDGESGCIIALTARIRASLVTADIRSARHCAPRTAHTSSHDSPSSLRYQPFETARAVVTNNTATNARMTMLTSRYYNI